MTRAWRSIGGIVAVLLIVGSLLAAVALTHPPGGAAAQGAATPAGTPTAKTGTAQRLYQDFVTKLAANLGITDSAKVDAALKTTLDQMVDEQQAAGRLKPKTADALKQRIAHGDFAPAVAALFQGKHAAKPAKTGKAHHAKHAPVQPTPAGTPAV